MIGVHYFLCPLICRLSFVRMGIPKMGLEHGKERIGFGWGCIASVGTWFELHFCLLDFDVSVHMKYRFISIKWFHLLHNSDFQISYLP